MLTFAKTQEWTLIIDLSDPYKFCFYCSATHVTSQVLQPKSVNKWYRGRHTVISVHLKRFFRTFPLFKNIEKFEMKAVDGMTIVKTTSAASDDGFFMYVMTSVWAYLFVGKKY